MSEIAFKDDIIDRAAEELGMERQYIRYLYEFCTFYVQKLAEKSDCCSFNLPNLGTIYIKNDWIDEKLENPKDFKERNVYQYKREGMNAFLKAKLNQKHKIHHYAEEGISGEIEKVQYAQNRVYNNREDI